MKNIYTIILIFAVAFTVTAQNTDTKKADELFDKLAYTDAADAYQKLIKSGKGSRYVYEKLADSYLKIGDTKQAETYYKRIVKGRKVNPEALYKYAQSLKSNGKLADYSTWMNKFAQMNSNDSRAKEFLKNPNSILELTEALPRFSATNLEDINTEYSEFGGFVVGKDFYFSSARNTTRRNYKWDDQPFLDVYKAELVGEDAVKNAALLSGDVNTKFHEGNIAITADGNRMYFDRNDYLNGKYNKSEEGINQINLYYTEKVAGSWKGVFSVPFNTSEHSTGHPALSPDGNTLYFVSDRPGGKGGSDIYSVSISGTGQFGTPQNLGETVNTEGKEVFPYVDSQGNLYFSSDGHLGIGGLDAFIAESKGSSFGTPLNLGKGANSEADDFAFIYDPNTQKGYVSSNRKGGKGKDDIYRINAIDTPCDVDMDIVVVNKNTNEPIFGAQLDLYDDADNKLSTKSTAEDGKGNFDTACADKFIVQASMKDFEPNSATILEANKHGKLTKTIKLTPIEAAPAVVVTKIDLAPILFDYDKSNIKPQAAFELDKLVAIMKNNPTMIIKVESHTDTRGMASYNRTLSHSRAQSTVAYVISQGIEASRISGQGFGLDRPAVNCGSNCSEVDHQANRRSDFIIVKR